MPVRLRNATVDDAGLLLRLYGATREDDLGRLPLAPAQREALVAQQHDARERAFAVLPGLVSSIVVADGEAVGRLLVQRLPEGLHVVDIAILPGQRGRSIATGLLHDLVDEAAGSGLPVTLHAAEDDRAAVLYARLGFVTEGATVAGDRRLWRVQPKIAS